MKQKNNMNFIFYKNKLLIKINYDDFIFKIKSVKNKKSKKIKVKWKKAKRAKGYEVQYARNSLFTKSVKTKSTKKLSLTIARLKKNKKYYVRVRAYTKDSSGKKIYGSWSKVKKVKIKK